MKIENIPADIKSKSLKEARDEINEILVKLESNCSQSLSLCLFTLSPLLFDVSVVLRDRTPSQCKTVSLPFDDDFL